MQVIHRWKRIAAPLCALAMFVGGASTAHASQAYGSLNNFDCVNDTGVETHGFEIEIDYGHSTDVTYTYDWNHYGTPKVSEDASDPLHPRVFIRYEAKKNPDGSWAAYTAVPSGPISPTQGHQFTDPSVNFGGEHFGVGFNGSPAAVKYNWLIDDGAGNLIHGPAVNISTPTFTYVPPAPAQPAKVVAKVVVPPPPVLPPKQFGEAVWVKEIKTTSHNPRKIKLDELVGDDPGKPQPWANGEAPEIEMEWKMLQTEFAAKKGGKNGELNGAPEGLPRGNEVVTRRYEFYKYTGPIDAETGEAMADAIGPDGKHGVGSVTYAYKYDPINDEWLTKTVDLSKIVVVGDFFGTQMAGFDLAPALGLIEHIENYDVYMPIAKRMVAITGGSPLTAKVSVGKLPPGLKLSTTGMLSGTPLFTGVYNFTIDATDTSGAHVAKAYSVTIQGPDAVVLTTTANPTKGGKTTGGGTFMPGTTLTVNTVAKPGWFFVNWTDNGVDVSDVPSYTFTINESTNLVANYVQICNVATSCSPAEAGTTMGDGSYLSGDTVTVTATPNAGWGFSSWTLNGQKVSGRASYTFTVSASQSLVANFVHAYTITAQATKGGIVTGSGVYNEGRTVTLQATAKAGYAFTNWTVDGVEVSTSPTYTFPSSIDRTVVAHFTKL